MKKTWIASACIAFSLVSVGLFASCGDSAYDIAKKNGFVGTEAEWLESLKGSDGQSFSMQSAYDFAVQNGFEGDYSAFLKEYLSENATITNRDGTGVPIVKSSVLSVVGIESGFTREEATFSPGSWWIKHETKAYYTYGSGVIYSLDKEAGDAYVVTNFHVVYDSDSNEGLSPYVNLYLYGQESLTLYGSRDTVSPYSTTYAIPATFVGGSASQDIAVLKVEANDVLRASNARAAVFGDSNAVQIGDSVYTIGNPSAYGIAISYGIVSKESDYTTLSAIDGSDGAITPREIRTDAAVNGGNSGGGLFNADGELVGIVNAKSIATNVEGMGYALPSTMVKYLVQNIIDNSDGTSFTGAKKAQLGITVTIASSTSKYNADTDSLTVLERTRITDVNEGGAAYGKLLPGDYIVAVSVNGETTTINRRFEFMDLLYAVRLGDTITVTVQRGGAFEKVEIVFDQEAYFVDVL